MDFEASFSGDFSHTNRWGNVNEQGQAQYTLSQRTTVDTDPEEKTAGIIQTQSEQLQSNYVKHATTAHSTLNRATSTGMPSTTAAP